MVDFKDVVGAFIKTTAVEASDHISIYVGISKIVQDNICKFAFCKYVYCFFYTKKLQVLKFTEKLPIFR